MAYSLIGKNFTPPDVHGKVNGKAKYAEDFTAEGMLYARLLTSPVPHARIRRIDTSAAVDEKTAEDAIAAITFEFEALPFTVDPLARTRCLREKQPWSVGDLESGFNDAAFIIDESFVTASHSHLSMEPRSVLSYWENGKCFIYGSSQSQSFPVPGLAAYIGIAPEDLVFVAEFCGGGFGSKGAAFMGFGMAGFERHAYDPQNGLPANSSLYQAKPPTYLDAATDMSWAAIDKADPENPVGAKGIGEPIQGCAAAALLCAISDALGGHNFNRVPVTADMIINAASGRPQSQKPLQTNTT